jgi:hypothetical protein
MHNFTEEPIEIATPRKVVTLSYTGRVDIFEVFFKDITECEDKVKPVRIVSPTSKLESPQEENNIQNAPIKKAKIDQNIINSDAKELAPKNIGSIFSTMKIDDKPAFLNLNTENKVKIENKLKVETNSKNVFGFAKPDQKKEETKVGPPKFGAPFLANAKKTVSFSESKLASGNSKVSNYQESPVKKSILKHQEITPNKNEPIYVIKEDEKTNSPSDEELVLIMEEDERNFLDSIEDGFSKMFLKTQYNLANDVNKSFKQLNSIDINYESVAANSFSEVNRYKERLWAYVIGSDSQKRDLARLADSTKSSFESSEKINHYWNIAKDADDQNHNLTRSRLGNNDLFSRDIESTVCKGEQKLYEASKFVNIMNDLTLKARTLNKNFTKSRTANIHHSSDDPFLSKNQNSTYMRKLMQQSKNKPE